MIPDPVQAEMVVPVTQGSGQGTPLPEPRKTRWQPLRSGFLNVFRFDREEFWYEDGHLLLRGNNGTGKSRVLALQLPFLLDGEAASHRLEPDGDPAKRLEWNLLMGRHEDRLGYTWIEFGRLDEGGVAHFVTLGCGIHASQGRSPGRWHFVTRQRIGRDLFLQMPDGTAIGREALEHAIGTAGQVFTQVDRYRRAVDQVLFRLGDRYEALLDLLIQLRKPQLSRELDEKRLSRALSEALPPLGRSVLDDVADAFRELEKDREQLAGLDTARAATEKFHGRYLRYAQAAVRRRAQDVLGAHRDFDLTMRKLREAESERDEAGQKRDHAQGELDRLKSRAGVLDQEIKTFESSPEMRGKEALDSAARAVQDRKGYFDQAGLNALKADQTRRKRHDDLDSAKARSARSLEVLATATCAAAKTAGEADLANAHTGAIGSLGLPDVVSREAATIADGRIRKAIDDRFAAIKTLQSLADVKAEKEADWKQARETREKADRDRESAIEARQQAVQDHETFVEDLWQRFEGWLGSLRHLAFPAGAVEATVPDDESGLSWLEDLGDRFRAWSDAPGGPGPFAEAVTEARDRAVRRLARQESEFQVLLGDAEARRIELESERERLLAGVHLPPPAPYTRDPGVRDDRDGAPLWALCDFAEQMSESDRAGLEAALEGAGLLDAWVTPEGHLVLPGEHDAFLVAPTAPPAEEGQTLDPGLGQRPTRTLDQALVVAIDPADARASSVAPEMLERILAQISLKETHLETAGRNWVSVDGCWQLGPLRGSWMKPEAEHIGAGAREASRKRRLADVIAKLEQTAAEIEDLGRRLEGVARELKATDDEARRAPQEAPLFLLVAARNEAIKREREAAERQDQAGRVEAEQRRAFNRAVEDLGQAAADLGLGSWIDDLGGLRDVTERYRRSVDQLDTAIGRHLDGLEAVAAAARLVEEAGRELARHQEALAIARTGLEEARTQLQVLESTVGKSVAEVLAKLESARNEKKAVALGQADADKSRTEAVENHAAAREAATTLGEALSRHQSRREEAIGALQALAGARLLGLALPDVVWPKGEAWSATRGVELSRQADFALAEVAADEEAWRRLQNDLYSRFREFEDELMRRGIVATGSPQGDLFLVSVSFQNSDMGVDEARSALIAEINARHAVLSASEKRVIENHLLGEVAAQIGDRLHQAESMVERMNREVAHCQTTAGMILKFRWLIGEEAPVGIKDARALLMRTGTMRSPQEQEALASFLQGRISAERSQGDAGSWYQILARALDYRSWHEFQVERQQDGKWVRLTKRTHGTGSGGEKAIALTVPQFAAAAAHYSSADEIAPRLILLDEAFVGVDKQVRSRAMGLLAAFDLDFVMTSENEWGCYPTLPHVAIYQLSGKAGIDAVGTTRFVWNGRERRRADVLPPPATASIIGRSGGREGDGGDEVPPAPQLGLDFGALPASSSER